RGYAYTLQLALRWRPAILMLFVAVAAATVWAFRTVPKGFIPEQDDDTINVSLRAAQGTAFDEMVQNVQTVGNIVRKNPNLQRAVAFLGNGSGGSANTARILLRMKPRAQRGNTAQQIVAQTRPLLGSFPRFRTFVTLPPAFQIGGRQGDNVYSVTLQSDDA